MNRRHCVAAASGCRFPFHSRTMMVLAVLSLVFEISSAWGSSSSTSQTDDTIYGNSFTRDWLYNSKSISLKVEGCAWGYVEDSEEVGCLEDGSDDGTTNWYMMANCRRPQVVFSVYASSSGSTSCNSNNFVGSVSDDMIPFWFHLFNIRFLTSSHNVIAAVRNKKWLV